LVSFRGHRLSLQRTLSLGSLSTHALLGWACLCSIAACGPGPDDPVATRRAALADVSATIPAGPGDAFVDVTAEAGLDFAHVLLDGEMDNIVESLGSGAAFLDYDGDGFLDVYFVQTGWRDGVVDAEQPRTLPQNRLYRNLHDGRFADVTERAGVGDTGFGIAAVAADYDGDGLQDLYLCNVGPNRLYRNRGDGRFEEVGRHAGVDDPRFSAGATFVDVDGDSLLDLYVANYLEYDPAYNYFYSPDVFSPPLAYEAQPDSLYRNRGDGTFEDVSLASGIARLAGRGMSVLASDFDDDGWTDIFVANDESANFLWRNDGAGSFEEIAERAGVAYGVSGDATAAMTADRGDCDGDGLLDMVVTDTAYGSLYRGAGAGVFVDEVFQSGIATLSGQYVS